MGAECGAACDVSSAPLRQELQPTAKKELWDAGFEGIHSFHKYLSSSYSEGSGFRVGQVHSWVLGHPCSAEYLCVSGVGLACSEQVTAVYGLMTEYVLR